MGVSVGWECSVHLVLPWPHCEHRSTEGPRMAVPALYWAAAVSWGPSSGEGSSSTAAVLLAASVWVQRWQFGDGLVAGIGSLLSQYLFGVVLVLVQCWFAVGLMSGVSLVPVCSKSVLSHSGAISVGSVRVGAQQQRSAVLSVSAQCHPAVLLVPSWCPWVPRPPPPPPLRTPSPPGAFITTSAVPSLGFTCFFSPRFIPPYKTP